jgi:hypothetical protein
LIGRQGRPGGGAASCRGRSRQAREKVPARDHGMTVSESRIASTTADFDRRRRPSPRAGRSPVAANSSSRPEPRPAPAQSAVDGRRGQTCSVVAATRKGPSTARGPSASLGADRGFARDDIGPQTGQRQGWYHSPNHMRGESDTYR